MSEESLIPGEEELPPCRNEEGAVSEETSDDFGDRLKALEAERDGLSADLARARADFYNYRTRVDRDRERDRALAAERAVDQFFPVLDNLDRTLAAAGDADSSLVKGVDMVRRQFRKVLESMGLEAIPGEGVPFDPAIHEAVELVTVQDPSQDGAVIGEIERGWILAGKVLKASRVRVGRLSPFPESEEA
jgi:molecular chaperone GrpE